MSFEFHVQAFSNLLNQSLLNPDNSEARILLDRYSVFQSAPRIYRRFNNSRFILRLLGLKPTFTAYLIPSAIDLVPIRMAILTNQSGKKLHLSLIGLLRDPPSDPNRWLPEFHSFFTWFLDIVHEQLRSLKQLRTQVQAPDVLLVELIGCTIRNLALLRYFAWDSAFFTSYICMAFEGSIATATQDTRTPLSSADEHDAGQEVRRPERDEDETLTNDEDREEGLDISTEFESGEEQQSSTTQSTLVPVHPCVLELRLITSNVQNIETLLQRAPKVRFRFEVIRYGRSKQSMKPWRELIHELFPDAGREAQVLRALCEAPGHKFDFFRPNGPDLKFKGQAHCEAVMACLYSLSKRGEDIGWVTNSQFAIL